jgi:hypothetical protein
MMMIWKLIGLGEVIARVVSFVISRKVSKAFVLTLYCQTTG